MSSSARNLFSHFVALLIALATSTSATAQENDLPGLPGFTALALPRTTVRVGARWLQGIGTDGDGASANNLTTTPAAEVLNSNTSLQAGIAARFSAWLGITAEAQKQTSTEIGGLSIVSVLDLSKTQVQPGNLLLYEAVLARSIKYTSRTGVSAEAVAAATVRAKELGLSVEVAGENKVTISGSNVYIGYRVIELQTPIVRDRKATSQDASRIGIGDYVLSLDLRPLFRCICTRPESMTGMALNRHVHSCFDRESVPASAINPRLGSVGSGGKTVRFSHQFRGLDAPQWITLDTRPRTNSIEVDLLNIHAVLSRSAVDSCIRIAGEELNEDYSRFELRTIQYRFSSVDKPKAPGW